MSRAPKKGRTRIEDRAKTIEAGKPWLKLEMSRRTWHRRKPRSGRAGGDAWWNFSPRWGEVSRFVEPLCMVPRGRSRSSAPDLPRQLFARLGGC